MMFLFVYLVGFLLTWPALYRWAFSDYRKKDLSWNDSDRNFHIVWSFVGAILLWWLILPLAIVFYFIVKTLKPLFKKLER